MELNMNIKANLKFSAFYIFFIIYSVQLGVGTLDVPKHIFKLAHQDSWISILIIFVYMIIVITSMLLILNQYENADIFSIQIDIFGKWIGKTLGTIYVVYFLLTFLTILLTYTHLIQLFLYPAIPSFVMGLILMTLVTYSVLGGIRVIVGVAFIFFLLTPWVFLLLYDPITRIEITHYQPMFQASLPELLQAAKETAYTFLGFELLFIVYPYIQNKQKTKYPAFLGVGATTLLVLIFTIISIGYYSPQDFKKMDWAVLKLFKSVSSPLLERFDYVVVAEWMMIVIPTMIFFMWAVTHGIKRLFAIKQKTTLYIVAITLFIINSFVEHEYVSKAVTSFVTEIGFWLVFVYPIILLPIVLIKKGWRKQKGRAQ